MNLKDVQNVNTKYWAMTNVPYSLASHLRYSVNEKAPNSFLIHVLTCDKEFLVSPTNADKHLWKGNLDYINGSFI